MFAPRLDNVRPPLGRRLRLLLLMLSVAGSALGAVACSDSGARDPAAGASLEPAPDPGEAQRESREPVAAAPSQTEEGEAREPTLAATALDDSLTRSLDGALPGSELPAPNRPWTGDLDGMVERRLIRALVTFSRTNYFLDGADQKGLSYEGLKQFEKHLNPALGHISDSDQRYLDWQLALLRPIRGKSLNVTSRWAWSRSGRGFARFRTPRTQLKSY